MKDFYGNREIVDTLESMIERDRIPQTILLGGPEGVGKATLARRFAARLVGREDKIEQDDLSRPEHAEIIAEREKMPADRRTRDPLLFSTHPDFVTFPPDGPLRQITIDQMRLLRERAQFLPLKGNRRVFLIDGIDRANEQAANSLLKTLEEPPPYLIIVATAANPWDLLPTIRSRAVPLYLTPLSEEEMRAFVQARQLGEPDRRIGLAGGCPGAAVSLDLETYSKRRSAMLSLLEAASGVSGFDKWMRHSEAIGQSRSEKLDQYLKVLYVLLQDVLALAYGSSRVRNTDVRKQIEAIAGRVNFSWILAAVERLDELDEFSRRSIQKSIALDALVLQLRTQS